MTGEPEGLDELLEQMQRLQADLANAESGIATRRVVGSSGGGAVRVTVSGEFSFDEVRIDPAALIGNDISVIEDLVLAACRDAVGQLVEVRHQAMGDAVGQALGSLFGAEGGAFDLSQLAGALDLGEPPEDDQDDDPPSSPK